MALTFSSKVVEWSNIIKNKYGDSIASKFSSVVNNEFENEEELLDDLKDSTWDESTLIDYLHDQSIFNDDNQYQLFFAFLYQEFVKNSFQNISTTPNLYDNVLSISLDTTKTFVTRISKSHIVDNIIWDVNNKQKEEAIKYLRNIYRGYFNIVINKNQNKSLIEMQAIALKNNIPQLLSIIYCIYTLTEIEQNTTNNANNNCNQLKSYSKYDYEIWCNKVSPYFRKYNKTKLIINAIREYKKRIVGASFNRMIVGQIRIRDYLSNYIKYTLIINNVISNILNKKENNQCCPLQIDLIIFGKYYLSNSQNIASVQSDISIASDVFDDYLDNMTNGNNLNDDDINDVNYSKKIPNFKKLFDTNKGIKYTQKKINLKKMDGIRIKRDIEMAIQQFLTLKKRNQRICILIDRTNGMEENIEPKYDSNDICYVYQINDWNEIPVDYCEETMHFLTKTAIIPTPSFYLDDNNDDQKDIATNDDFLISRKYKGGDFDISHRNFVISYHIHAKNNITYLQYIKSQRMNFLPYHMITLWPYYFADDNTYKFKSSGAFNVDNIYEKWMLPLKDERLTVWFQFIDPKNYHKLKTKHLDCIK